MSIKVEHDRTDPFKTIKCPECNGKLTFRPPGIVCKLNNHKFGGDSDIWHEVKALVTGEPRES